MAILCGHCMAVLPLALLLLSLLAATQVSEAIALLQMAAREGQDSACSDMPDVSEVACLEKNDDRCMWLQLDHRNLCLPCMIDKVPIPCVPPGAVYPQGAVKACSMACDHQEMLTKVSPCTDVSGEITQTDCEAKGDSGEAKCMWTSYKTSKGLRRSMCGPCLVEGTGVVPPYEVDGVGPEYGSRVEAVFSQCDEVTPPCNPTPCTPPPPAKALGGLPAPVPLADLGLSTITGAPFYVAVPVEAPYDIGAYERAAASGAKIAGWPEETLLPPSAAVAVYGARPLGAPVPPPQLRMVQTAMPPGLRGLLIQGPHEGTPATVPSDGDGVELPSAEAMPGSSGEALLLEAAATHAKRQRLRRARDD